MAQCFQCGQSIPEGQERVSGEGSSAFIFCASCAPANAVVARPPAGGTVAPPPAAPPLTGISPTAGISAGGGVATVPKTAAHVGVQDNDKVNYLGAILLGFAAAVLASLLWYGFVVLTNIQFGLVAVIIGWAIGFGVVKGSGNQRGFGLVVISLALTLFAMMYSLYLVIRHFINEETGEALFPIFADPIVMVMLNVAYIKEDLLTLLFWAIALYGAYKLPSGAADDDE
jgi:hypothetical protein